jgi:hypothetical protein
MDNERPTNEETGGEAELEVMRRENEALARQVEAGIAGVARLEQALAGKDAETAALKQSLDEAKGALDEMGKTLVRAVSAYKELIIQGNPGLLAELINGDTIEAVDESLRQARALVERVRQELEAEAARTRVPAGSPQRAPLDLSGLSAREKIQYAIGGAMS